jgi:hypothetical protein
VIVLSFVKQFSKKRDGNYFITPNFKVSEFACHDGTDKVLIDIELVSLLQLIRNFMNVPININSGYRTQSYNRKIGGATNSYHTYGRAFDCSSNNNTKFVYLANGLGIRGIIRYDTFTHIDTRDTIYHANYGSNKFDFDSLKIPYPNRLVSKGEYNYLVGCVQFRLKIKGYDVGNCDGIFGERTYSNLVRFQQNNRTCC